MVRSPRSRSSPLVHDNDRRRGRSEGHIWHPGRQLSELGLCGSKQAIIVLWSSQPRLPTHLTELPEQLAPDRVLLARAGQAAQQEREGGWGGSCDDTVRLEPGASPKEEGMVLVGGETGGRVRARMEGGCVQAGHER